ncbi:hypothetical protein [Shinella zoogloeoides]|uniref:hypothetical protein n=1 Tax=Shinella zoogloeoides TaxID=352475 RepID=UPI00273E38C9|nr:hypothetical protein [Shinella zoogloeoides]WLR90924.1 hypothetical protein Q9316_00675 [Shinella zoogloeoides]
MHISQLNHVSKLSSELSQVRSQLAATEDTGVRVSAGSGAYLGLSESTLETFTKLAAIELAEKEAKLVEQLEDLGVEATELPDTCGCDGASAKIEVGPADVLNILFGGLHTGGVAGAQRR